MSNLSSWFNSGVYSQAQLGLMVACHACWAAFTVFVLRSMKRHGVLEIPAAAVAANFAFATVWGLIYGTNLGNAFVWIMRGALLIELGVFGYVLINGAKHVRIPEVRHWFKAGMVVSYLCWLAMLGTFARQGYELPTGLVSALMVSLFMSAQYLFVELSAIEPEQYSLGAGWAKLLANVSASVFCFSVYPQNHFLLSLCAITVVLDVAYVGMFKRRRSSAPYPERP